MSDDVCVICQEPFNNEVVEGLAHEKITLPCFETHVFGRSCLALWFDNGRHQTCPICRQRVSDEFAAGVSNRVENRSFYQRIIDAATNAGLSIFDSLETALRDPLVNIVLFGGSAWSLMMASGMSEEDTDTLTTVFNAATAGSIVGGVLRLNHLPVIRVLPHVELLSRLATGYAGMGALLDVAHQRQAIPDRPLIALSQTTASSMFGFGLGFSAAEAIHRLLGNRQGAVPNLPENNG
ncbi:hypothetical protein NX722_07705 [Endozoicomonas gorgoniicola]|uniref:RING-type domain-containing protein n=1 Tax=Endozoicomonas gorgoniicola TaxID=1234144 RepID=A0ABT3MT58_9GAMM|nr:RING finger domain-containing protein [Endozoicomonas gorgoniicola]MCW7552533.1 hypothetical protein [Endozoicomonas gorgoniicola]